MTYDTRIADNRFFREGWGRNLFGEPVIEVQDAGVPCVVSNTISREADITGTMEFLSLNDSAEKWVNSIIGQRGKRNIDNPIKIKNSGYDMRDVAKKLEIELQGYMANRKEKDEGQYY